MAKEVKVSSKYQIVIPKEAREYANIKAGDELLIEGVNGKLIILKRPKDYTDYTAGLHKEIWKGVDPLEYIRKLRKEWNKRTKRK